MDGNNRFTGTMKDILRFSRHSIRYFLFSCLIFSAFNAFAQKPEIKSLDKVQGPNGDLVSISGSNFGNNANQLSVFFGAAKGTIQTVSDQSAKQCVVL